MISTALWLDANDSATITESGGAITTWADKSGNNRTDTADGNPTYSATGMSTSKPAVQLDGTGDGFVSSITGIGSFNALDVYMVTQTTAAAAINTNSGAFWGYGNISGAAGAYPANQGLVFASSTSSFATETIALFLQSGVAGVLGSTTYSRAANTAQILNSKYSTLGTSLFANGAAISIDLADQATASTNSAPSALTYTNDTNFRVGSFRTGGNLIYSPAIKFAEVIVSSTLLSTLNRQRIEGYLAHKWGLEANLPNDHPYKNVGPTP
jgi:Zn-dependent protease with chaperone function